MKTTEHISFITVTRYNVNNNTELKYRHQKRQQIKYFHTTFEICQFKAI